MGVITTLEIQKNNKERVNVYLDGEYAFSLSLMDAARLHKGQVLDDDQIAVLRAEDGVIRAVDSAVRFLAFRPRSVQEVRRNLKEKSLDDRVIDAALERLMGLGYLDDEAFARFWVDNRTAFKPLGPAALKFELRQKGVADSIIEQVLSNTDPHATAYTAARERVARLRGTDRRTFQNKLGSFLQRRGFRYDVIGEVVSRLVEELSESDAEYFITVDDDAL